MDSTRQWAPIDGLISALFQACEDLNYAHSSSPTELVQSDSYHHSAHQRATPEEGGGGILAVVFQKTPVIKRGHQL
jgi:hypothetical protein